jgi:malate dehydrogenase
MRSKVTVVGAGNVGANCAVQLAQRELADVVVVDVMEGIPTGKALDILQSGPVVGADVTVTGVNDYAPTAGSDILVFTAGFPRKPGMSRDDLLWANYEVAKATVEQAVKHSPNSILIMVTNPLDAMCHVAHSVSGFPKHRVMGMAGVLDSTRFRYFIAERLGVWPGDVQAMVLGGHGDEMVPLTIFTSVGGVPIGQLLDAAGIEELVKRTRTGGAEIVGLLKTGSAFYAPGASVAKMVEAVIKNEKRLLPASAFLRGEFGFKDIFLGVPVILGRNGVERIVELPLSDGERKALEASAEAVRKGLKELEGL